MANPVIGRLQRQLQVFRREVGGNLDFPGFPGGGSRAWWAAPGALSRSAIANRAAPYHPKIKPIIPGGGPSPVTGPGFTPGDPTIIGGTPEGSPIFGNPLSGLIKPFNKPIIPGGGPSPVTGPGFTPGNPLIIGGTPEGSPIFGPGAKPGGLSIIPGGGPSPISGVLKSIPGLPGGTPGPSR